MVGDKATGGLRRSRKENFCGKLANVISTASLLALALLLSVWFYWSVLDYYLFPVDAIVTTHYISLEPEGEEVVAIAAGTDVYINWRLDIHRSCPSTFERSIVNLDTDVVTMLLGHPGVAPSKGKGVMFATEFHIPNDLTPGPYAYNYRGYFTCNPIKVGEVRYPSIPFYVIEKEGEE